MDMLSPNSTMLERLQAFWEWTVVGKYKIKDKNGKIVPFKMNAVQTRLFSNMLALAKKKKPLRFVVLKARKEGISTFIQLLNSFLSQHLPHWKCCTIAHTDVSTGDIHEISERVFRLYKGAPQPLSVGNPLRWEHDSDVATRTAGGVHVSSGANINSLHLSELAKWQNARIPVVDQLASVLQSVPENPNSIVVIESTASVLDVTGQFKSRWEAAMQEDSPYVPFFSPWTEDPEYQIAGKWAFDLTDYEELLHDTGSVMVDLDGTIKRKVTYPQLAWWRKKLKGDFANDLVYARQEYPATPEEAFQFRSGLVFPMLDEKKNVAHAEMETILDGRQALYRGIDWGAVDAFVCVFIAHLPGEPGFTVDRNACPNSWRELTGYHYDDHGRPKDVNNHTVDAIRYVIMHYSLTGHVHVYREIYIPNSAARGQSLLDHSKKIIEITGSEPICGTVCDRSQPGSIQLMVQQGLYCEANRVPPRRTERGEVQDGIAQMSALMIASLPLQYPPPEPSWFERINVTQAEYGVDIGLDAAATTMAMNAYQESRQKTYDDIFGAF